MVQNSEQKYVRTKLNTGQTELLKLVYKYRFVSRQLVAESLKVKYGSSIYEKLEVLVKHDYLGKRLERRLKLQGIPAAYYLTPKGLRTLQALLSRDVITDSIIKSSYKDKAISMSFILHTLDVYKHTNILKRQYDGLRVFTRREIGQYEYFPSQLPDALLSLPTDDPQQPRRFFFDLVPDDAPRVALDRRIAGYCDFFDEGGWDITDSPLPAILLLSQRGAAEKRVRRNVLMQLGRSDIEDLQVFTSTAVALENRAAERAIWTSLEDADVLVELGAIL